MRRVLPEQRAGPPCLLGRPGAPYPLGVQSAVVELPVAPGRAGAAQGEQRAAQLPHPVWRDEPERLPPRAPRDVVAVAGSPAAHSAPGLRRLVCRAVRVPRPEVGLAVQLGALLGPAPEDSRVDRHRGLPSHAARAASSL